MDGTIGEPEDQKRSDDARLFSFVTKLLGQQRTMAKAMTQLADGLYEIAKAYAATELDIRKIREIERRAGREDAARDIGVQPTEEQRARDEDQKRGEETK